ncbi:hypothetical protein OS493_019857 [Desmophyllum pertusum]|uniref:Transmembrane protein n=1 Tax=Desmophyllum pertusum TaxID=174260 RepID=A0A9W9YN72_9CNID|nr:hypothetical protein OS493_019857 [Desmophyllum pertusum]
MAAWRQTSCSILFHYSHAFDGVAPKPVFQTPSTLMSNYQLKSLVQVESYDYDYDENDNDDDDDDVKVFPRRVSRRSESATRYLSITCTVGSSKMMILFFFFVVVVFVALNFKISYLVALSERLLTRHVL